MRRCAAAACLLLSFACKDPGRVERAAPDAATNPTATDAHRSGGASASGGTVDDLAWLTGTWKQDGVARWLLFDPSRQVAAELAGKPAGIVRRGTLVVHGRYVSALFPEGELGLVATPDHSRLTARGDPPATWRRGDPPP